MNHYGDRVRLNGTAFIHPTVELYGDISIGEGSSLWPHVVARCEDFEVKVGERTNIQDFVMIHVGNDTGTQIGDYCSITHRCTIHGCRIEDNCLIGINTTIMDGCVIGRNSIVAGHSFLKENTIIPPNSIVMGTPGKVVREQNNYVGNRINALLYYRNALAYNRGEHREWEKQELKGFIEEQRQLLTEEMEAKNE
jgi:carbonic anhydrase/acetyltransferase-like protein (isoleucine patch superfamily)